MLELVADVCRVQIGTDPTYTPGSADNLHRYEREYPLDDERHWTAKYSVLAVVEDQVVHSCISSRLWD